MLVYFSSAEQFYEVVWAVADRKAGEEQRYPYSVVLLVWMTNQLLFYLTLEDVTSFLLFLTLKFILHWWVVGGWGLKHRKRWYQRVQFSHSI